MSVLDKYFSLLEGANDATDRAKAQDVFRRIKLALQSGKGQKAIERMPGSEHVVFSIGKLIDDPKLNDLVLTLTLGGREKRRGSFSLNPANIKIFFDPKELGVTDASSIGDKWQDMVIKNGAKVLSVHGVDSTFTHEFTHYLDTLKMGDRAGAVHHKTARAQHAPDVGDQANKHKQYVNSPMEFNAFFQQGVGNIETYLDSLPPADRLKVAEKMMGSSPNEFLKKIMSGAPWFKSAFTKNLDDKNRAKFMKRVAQAYGDIMKKEKDAQKSRGGLESDKAARMDKLKAANAKAQQKKGKG